MNRQNAIKLAIKAMEIVIGLQSLMHIKDNYQYDEAIKVLEGLNYQEIVSIDRMSETLTKEQMDRIAKAILNHVE